MRHCDGVNALHELEQVAGQQSGVQEVCKKCKARLYFRRERSGRMEPAYNEAHRLETLQPWDNLYYRYHPANMKLL